MKKMNFFCLLFLVGFNIGVLHAQGDLDLYDRARLLLFEKKWEQALEIWNRLLDEYPQSKYFPLAQFYKGKCLEEQKFYKKALDSYNKYLKISQNKNLKEEATVAMIDLYFKLYQKGEKKYLNRIVGFLNDKQRTIQYFAAFKLSYAKNKKIASKAVPILKRMISIENDEELKDRAKIALMRINPDYWHKSSKKKSVETRMLHIQVYNKKLRKVTFSLSIPFILAKLALDAIPETEKKKLKNEGYNIDQVIRALVEEGEVFKIADEDGVFKIWIE
jgi:tetratricopeptide (TPR) repeat protein